MNDPQQPRPSASDVADDYDRIADECARRLYAELDAKPFDRTILDRFAALVGNGRLCEVGCGPGHVSRYQRDRGCDVFGIDLSPRMVELAAELNPEIEFQVGDLRALDLAELARSRGGVPAVCDFSDNLIRDDRLPWPPPPSSRSSTPVDRRERSTPGSERRR